MAEGTVFDFEVERSNEQREKTGTPSIHIEELKYEATKKKMGFTWWSLKKIQSSIWIILDGRELNLFLKEKGIQTSVCGRVKDVKLVTYKLLQFYVSDGYKIVMGLYHFKKEATEFSKTLPSIHDSSAFVTKLNSEIQNIDTENSNMQDQDNEEIDSQENDQQIDTERSNTPVDEEIQNIDTENSNMQDQDNEEIDSQENDQQIQNIDAENSNMQDQGNEEIDSQENDQQSIGNNREQENDTDDIEIQSNELIKEASKKKIGEFNLPIDQLQLAWKEHAIRQIDPNHVGQLVTSLRIGYETGDGIRLPTAIGLVPATTSVTDIQKGKDSTKVELIDGNHTLFAMKELADEFPEADCFKTRRVVVFRGLSTSEIYALGLLANEAAGQVKETKPFEMLTIMRRELYGRFNGTYDHKFQQHIYSVFNAVCPNDSKEQERRRKKIHPLIQLSTIHESCWEKIKKLQDMKPGHKLYIYKDLTKLGVATINNILELAIEKKIKMQEIPAKAKEELNVSETARKDQPAVKRIRQTFKGKKKVESTQVDIHIPLAESLPTEQIEKPHEENVQNQQVVDINEIKVLKASKDKLEDDIKNFKKDLDDQKKGNEKLSEEITNLKRENKEMETKSQKLTEEIKELKGINKKTDKKNEELQMMMDTMSEDIQNKELLLKNEKEELQKKVEELEKVENECSTTDNAEEDKIKDLSDKIDKLEKEKLEIETKNKDLQNSVLHYQAEEKRLTEEVKSTKLKNESLIKENGCLKAELELAKDSVKQMKPNRESQKRVIKKPEDSSFMYEQPLKKSKSNISEESILPFPLPNIVDSIPKREIDTKEEKCNIVEWNSKVYLAWMQDEQYIFCKKPFGDIIDGNFVNKEKKDSFILNWKDIQTVEQEYIISNCICKIESDIIILQDTSSIENCIKTYLKA